MTGTVAEIFTAPKAQAPMQSVLTAQLEKGRGIVGDRYFSSAGTFSDKLEGNGNSDWEVTLIESEEIDSFNETQFHDFSYGEFRRNLVTRDVRLNDLVGKQFNIGNVKLEGIRLCEPCATLAATVTKDVLPALIGRGGLRARILDSGRISVGDTIDSSI